MESPTLLFVSKLYYYTKEYWPYFMPKHVSVMKK